MATPEIMLPDLDAVIDGAIAPNIDAEDVAEGRNPWVATDLGGADWAARKAQRELAQVEARTKPARDAQDALMAEYERLEEYITGQRDVARRRVERWQAIITRYHQDLVAEEIADGVAPKSLTKTLTLPCGVKSEWRTAGGPQPVAIPDEAALLAWAKEYLAPAVMVVEKLDKNIIREELQAGGDRGLAQLAELAPRTESWKVKV